MLDWGYSSRRKDSRLPQMRPRTLRSRSLFNNYPKTGCYMVWSTNGIISTS